MVPTQQLVLTTYTHLFLFLLAIESIAVFHIVCRYEKKQETKASRHTWCSTSYATDMCMPLVRVPGAAGQQLWKQARACLLPRVVQKRKEAWRRYCKLRDQGKLEGGQNPTLASAASAAIPADTCPEDEEQQQSTATDGVDVDAEKPDMQTAVDNKQGWFNFTCSSCFKPPQRGDASIANGDLMAERTPRRQFGIFFRSPKVSYVVVPACLPAEESACHLLLPVLPLLGAESSACQHSHHISADDC